MWQYDMVRTEVYNHTENMRNINQISYKDNIPDNMNDLREEFRKYKNFLK